MTAPSIIDSPTTIPTTFGSGGANLVPGGSGGTPTLYTILQELQDATLALDAAVGGDSAANLASHTTGEGASLIGIEDAGGIITATTVEGALAEIKALVDAGMSVTKRTVTVAFNNAALVAANSNGTSASVNIGATLPANARIVGWQLKLATPFTGGSASAVTLKIGTSGDDDAIVASSDVFAAAVDGQASTNVFGIAPFKHFISSGAQLLAKFTPDGSHQLANLTAGSIVIDVEYIVLA